MKNINKTITLEFLSFSFYSDGAMVDAISLEQKEIDNPDKTNVFSFDNPFYIPKEDLSNNDPVGSTTIEVVA